jgi:hypothetical protein
MTAAFFYKRSDPLATGQYGFIAPRAVLCAWSSQRYKSFQQLDFSSGGLPSSPDAGVCEGASLAVMGESSPQVVDDGWGIVDVSGLGRFRDVKLWPGGGRAWDWRETGTDHRPGILCEDVTELVDHEPDLVVLSRGREGRLGVSPETLSLLATRGVPVVLEKTEAALATYNRLAAEGRRVAGLFHTTC